MGVNSIQRGPTLNHADSVARTFFIDVGRSSIVAYRLRFPVLRGDTVVSNISFDNTVLSNTGHLYLLFCLLLGFVQQAKHICGRKIRRVQFSILSSLS